MADKKGTTPFTLPTLPDLSSITSQQQLTEMITAAAALLQTAQMAAAAMAMANGVKVEEEEEMSAAESPDELSDPSPTKYTRNYICPHIDCGFNTRESRDYLHHLRDEHEEKFQIHYCELCHYASKFQAKVNRHKVLIHERGLLNSRSPEEVLCEGEGEGAGGWGEVEGGRGARKEEKEEKAGKEFKCTACPYETDDEGRFKKHLRCHNTKAETSCRFCDFETVYSWNLDRHMQGHNVEGRYTCLRCSYSQNTRQSMTFHLQHHHKIRRTDAEAQTDGLCTAWNVDVAREPYIFEKHAVRFKPQDPKPPSATSPALLTPTNRGSKKSGSAVRPDRKSSQSPLSTLSSMAEDESLRLSPGTVAARKARKYLSEQEAIESPSDEKDLKDFEHDPDVQSRVCSVCGYQGKWISEMIRHKRVHTNERPFKCKYCSRTSKWKADLIRHVAKVHGIRVVSKYSRTKTFDSDATMMRALKEQHGFVDGDQSHDHHMDYLSMDSPHSGFSKYSLPEDDDDLPVQDESPLPPPLDYSPFPPSPSPADNNNSKPGTRFRIEKFASIGKGADGLRSVLKCRLCTFESQKIEELRLHLLTHEECLSEFRLAAANFPFGQQKPLEGERKEAGATAEGAGVVWRCEKCVFHKESRNEVIDHLALVHELPPFSCPSCNFSSMFRKTVLYHLQTQHGEDSESLVLENLTYSLRPLPPSTETKRKHSDHGNDFLHALAKRGRAEKKESVDAGSSSSISTLSHPDSPATHSPALPTADQHACTHCPFLADTLPILTSHKKGHDTPKGLINYKCVFCDWYAKKSQVVFDHMRVHTDQPASYMAEVERNLITPLSLSSSTPSSTQTQLPKTQDGEGVANALEGFLPAADRRYRCQRCSFAASAPGILETHALIHHQNGDASGQEEANSKQTPSLSTLEDVAPRLEGMRDVLSDFSAILDAAGGNEATASSLLMSFSSENSLTAGSPQNWNAQDPDTDSEPEIEDEESYLHAGEDGLNAGLDFAALAPHEIKKVSVVLDGNPRRMWQCRYCPHVSKRRANVRMHEKKHFKKNPVGLLKCPKCNYRGDKRSLNAHYRVHVGDMSMPERYPCKLCPANFRQDFDRRRHIAFHDNNRPVKCGQCTYSVDDTGTMDMHAKVHSLSEGEEPEPPPTREDTVRKSLGKRASFSSHHNGGLSFMENLTSSNLFVPKSTAKPKKHLCTDCPARFADTTQLARHVQFHGVDHAHKCPQCNYAVPFKINLFKHLRSHHGVQELSENSLIAQPVEQKLLLTSKDTGSDSEDDARVTPDSEPGGMKIKISFGKQKNGSD